MKDVFEQELRELFGDGHLIQSPRFTGQACLGTLGPDLRVRIQFAASKIMDEYDALKVTVMNRTEGPVDTLTIKLSDVWGRKQVPDKPNFKNGVLPRIWVYQGKAEWYAYQPTQADREQLRQEVGQYLEAFLPERTHDSPKLVYICAPLRGDIEKNIEFAKQKAKEVFQEGNIPICPHLMFPPFADASDPAQDQTARDMGLRLVEICQQVNVYGPERTEGMRAEIRHAMEHNIPVCQEAIQRTKRRSKALPQR